METFFKSTESKPSTFTNIRTNAEAQIEIPEAKGDIDFFPGGVYIDQELVSRENHKKALTMLSEGLTKSLNFEKIHHKLDIRSFRAGGGARIIGICALRNNQDALFIFAYYDKHEYDKLKFINNSNLKQKILDLDSDLEHKNIINQTVKKIPKAECWSKAHYLDKKFICFAEDQQQIINRKYPLPVIVIGPAGSGKTLIIGKILHDLLINMHEDAPNQNYVYIASTDSLAQKARAIVAEFLRENNLEQYVNRISFMSIEQFISLYKPAHQKLRYKEDLMEWLTKKSKHKAFKTPQYNDLFANKQNLIEEFKTASIMSEDEYLELGEMQTLYEDKEDRKRCYDLYRSYKDNNSDGCQILFPELTKENIKFDLVIIDEWQNYTIKQLLVVSDCAKAGNFMLFGDPLQNITNRISVFDQLKQRLIGHYKQEEPLIILDKSYRNPSSAFKLFNGVALFRRQLSGGRDVDCETLQFIPEEEDSSNAASIEWINTLTTEKKTEISTLFSKTDTMIITVDEAHRTKARECFGEDLVILLPENIQGLEAEKVLVYCPFTKDTIRKINAYIPKLDLTKNPIYKPGSNSTGTSEFILEMNMFLMALTRVKKRPGKLSVYLGEHDPHHSALFIGEINKYFSDEKVETKLDDSISTNSMSPEEWIIQLYQSNNKNEAKMFYKKNVNEDDAGFDNWIASRIPKKQIPMTPMPHTEQSTQTNTQNDQSNTQNVSNINSIQKEAKATSLIFSAEELRIHQLLGAYNFLNLSTFLCETDAKEVLFYKYRSKDDVKSTKTLFETLINRSSFLEVLNKALLANPFATETITFHESKAMGIITEALSSIADVKNRGALYKLLEILVEQKPLFMNFFTKDFVLLTTQRDAIKNQFCLDMLHKLTYFNTELIIETINFISRNTAFLKHTNDWCIQLLKSTTGCHIIAELHRCSLNIFDYINTQTLKREMRYKRDEPPLFFWLTTSLEGQLVLKEMIVKYSHIKEAITIEMLRCPLKNSTHRYKGTNMLFWLLHGNEIVLPVLRENNTNLKTLDKLIQKEKFPHPDYTGKFMLGSDIQDFILKKTRCEKSDYIPFVPPTLFLPFSVNKFFNPSSQERELLQTVINNESKEAFEAALLAILKRDNAESLLFDNCPQINNSLYCFLINKDEYYIVFVDVLKENPIFCKLFTLERLNQAQHSNQAKYNVFSSILLKGNGQVLLQVLIENNPELVNDIHQQQLLYSPVFINETKKVKSLFSLLRINPNFASYFKMIQDKNHLTPKFFQSLFDYEPIKGWSGTIYTTSLFEILVSSNVNLLSSWLKIQPKLVNYLKVEHFGCHAEAQLEHILDVKTNTYVTINKVKSKFHELLGTANGFEFLNNVLNMREDLLNAFNFKVLCAKTQSANSPLYYLSCSNDRCDLLLRLLKSNESHLKMMTHEILLEISLKENRHSTLVNLMKSPKGSEVLELISEDKTHNKVIVTWSHIENKSKVDLTHYLKRVITSNIETNLRYLLLNLESDFLLFTKAPIRSNQEETLFEFILDTKDFLKEFLVILKKERLLASGALIHDSQYLSQVIEKISSGSEDLEQLISLFELLISNQPSLIVSISKTLLNARFIYLLSTHEVGLSALNTIVINYPEALGHLIESVGSEQELTDDCWFSNLLLSQLGCSILSCLYDFNTEVVRCANPLVLAKKSSSSNESQTPIYFWASSTLIGQSMLYNLFEAYPQLVLALSEEVLTQTVQHSESLHDKTSTLFWLTSGIVEEDSVLNKLIKAGVVSEDSLKSNLVHPNYLQPIIKSDTQLEPSNSYKELFFKAFSPIAENYSSHYSGHKEWSEEKLSLVYEVIDSIEKTDNIALEMALLDLLKHEEAESLLFDQIGTENQNLFFMLMYHDVRDIFRQVLDEYPGYYALFTLKRLNQMARSVEDDSVTVIQYLIHVAPDILKAILKNQESIKNSLTAEVLVQRFSSSKALSEENHLLSILLIGDNFKLLKHFNPLLLLRPELVAELFKIKPIIICDNVMPFNIFLFLTLFIKSHDIVTQWVRTDIRFLRYMQEEHLFTKTWKPGVPTSEFCCILSHNDVGRNILLYLVNTNPQLFKALSLEQLTSCNSYWNSMLFWLSATVDGLAFLEKLIKEHPEVIANICPSHLEEKDITFHESSETSDSLTTLDYLVDSNNLTVLESFLALPGFEEIFFRNNNKLLYKFCNKLNGLNFLTKMFNLHPIMTTFFTKDILCKASDQLPFKNSFILYCLSEQNEAGKNLLYAIVTQNPSLLGLTKTQVLQEGRDVICNQMAVLQSQYEEVIVKETSAETEENLESFSMRL